MKQSPVKPIFLWITGVIIFFLGFYLSSQRNQLSENSAQHNLQDRTDTRQVQGLKQNIAEDFETAFLKQYTPPVDCDPLSEEVQSTDCQLHLQQAKNKFKEDFIKNRGLPKNTFEELKLSFKE